MISQLIDSHLYSSSVKTGLISFNPEQIVNAPTKSINTLEQSINSAQPNFQKKNSQKIVQQNEQPSEQLPALKLSSSRLSDLITGSNTCQQCSKTFLKHAHLLRHINEKHESNRSYVCNQPDCGKTFKRDSHLRRHLISHTHQKPFKCTQCIMAFGYKHHLDRHVKAVHEKAFLTCQECGQKFVKKKPFLKHVEKVHSKNKSSQQKNLSSKKSKSTAQNASEKGSENVSGTSKTKQIRKSKSKEGLNEKQVFQNDQQQEKVDYQFDQERPIDQVEIYSYENESMNDRDQIVVQNDKSQFKRGNKKQENLEKNSQRLLFRCIYPECVSAFGRMHELTRHINQRHNGLAENA